MKHIRSALTRSSLGATKSRRSAPVLAGLALGTVLAVGTAVPASAASLPSSDRIYAYECGGANDFQLLEIQADGTATAIGTGIDLPGDVCPAQPAWDPVTQKAYFVSGGNVYSTDISTGVSTVVTTTSGAAGNTSGANNYLLTSPSLAIAPDGTAWVLNEGYVGTIDLATGIVTEITADPNTNRDQGLYYMDAFAYNGADSKLYTIDADDKTDDSQPLPNELLTVGQTTGAVTLGTGVPIQGYQNGSIDDLLTMGFDSSGQGWMMDTNSSSQLKSFDTAGTVVDQGAVLIGASAVSYCSMFIATPSSGGGSVESPVDDGYLDYQRGRVEGEGSTDLPDTGGSVNALNVIVGLGCLAVGSTLVAASRRRRYS